MSENKLREAYTLMKEGNKSTAARLVQEVLHEDKGNSNAWWLFSHLLEDEEKTVKCLEKVLALNPEHAGARKKLASMRPEYAHLAAPSDTEKVKSKTDQQSAAYWNKLNEAGKVKPTQVASGIGGMIWNGMGIRFKIFLFMLPFMIVYAIFFNMRNQEHYVDKNGNTPLNIAEKFYGAMYQEDIDALYALTCPARYEKIDELVANFGGWNPADVAVDTSKIEFYVNNQQGEVAYVTVYGSVTIDYEQGASVFTIDLEEEAAAEGYDAYGIFFKKTDDVWQVCNPYYISDLEYNDN
jgi:hypothetical protein